MEHELCLAGGIGDLLLTRDCMLYAVEGVADSGEVCRSSDCCTHACSVDSAGFPGIVLHELGEARTTSARKGTIESRIGLRGARQRDAWQVTALGEKLDVQV
jgi:hypothetical protein